MSTSDLIERITREAKPVRRERPAQTLTLAAACALGLAVLGVLLFHAVRPDFEAAAIAVALKATFAALVAAVAFPVAARLARPGRTMGVWLVAAAIVTLACISASTVLMWTGYAGFAALAGEGFPFAILIIPLLATPAGVMIFAWYRRFAPTRLALAGASVGALAGGLGAVAYALVCPVDNAGFVVTWYGAAIVLCIAVGALVGPRVLKW